MCAWDRTRALADDVAPFFLLLVPNAGQLSSLNARDVKTRDLEGISAAARTDWFSQRKRGEVRVGGEEVTAEFARVVPRQTISSPLSSCRKEELLLIGSTLARRAGSKDSAKETGDG